jgi:hypothetical protein
MLSLEVAPATSETGQPFLRDLVIASRFPLNSLTNLTKSKYEKYFA